MLNLCFGLIISLIVYQIGIKRFIASLLVLSLVIGVFLYQQKGNAQEVKENDTQAQNGGGSW